jgi:hypothetical protein
VSSIPVVIDARFQGPDGSGQGGYTCGLVGVAAGTPAEVRLRHPPPLGRPLELRITDDAVLLLDDADCVVAEGWTLDSLEVDVPAPPVLHADAQLGAEAFVAHAAQQGGHPFPRCFGCGTDREPGDGLRVFAGPVPGRAGIFAGPWLPDDSLTLGGSDEVRDEFTWAALDCPTGAPVLLELPPDRAIVLGTMAAHIVARPRVGYRYVIMSWLEESTDTLAHGCAALLGERGDVLAVARGTWVYVDRERFGGG